MSKKGLLRAIKHNRVIAIPSKTKMVKGENGDVAKQLYNLYKLG